MSRLCSGRTRTSSDRHFCSSMWAARLRLRECLRWLWLPRQSILRSCIARNDYRERGTDVEIDHEMAEVQSCRSRRDRSATGGAVDTDAVGNGLHARDGVGGRGRSLAQLHLARELHMGGPPSRTWSSNGSATLALQSDDWRGI